MTARQTLHTQTELENEVRAAAQVVATALAPQLERQLRRVYGERWLDAANDLRTKATGAKPARGLGDHRFCLAVAIHDPAVSDCVGDVTRKQLRRLSRLATAAAHNESLDPNEAAWTTKFAASFQSTWSHAAESPGVQAQIPAESRPAAKYLAQPARAGAAASHMGNSQSQIRIDERPPSASFFKMLGTGAADTVTWTPQGDYLVAAGSGGIAIWPLTGHRPERLSYQPYSGAAISPDGRFLAAHSRGAIHTWNLAYRSLGTPLHSGVVHAIAWSPDGNLAAACDDGAVRIWNPVHGTLRQTLTCHMLAATAVAWRHDGRYLAVGGAARCVQIWDPLNAARVRVLEGHEGRITSLAWSPDGFALASGAQDCVTRVWEPLSGTTTHTIADLWGSVDALAWSPDGKHVSIGSADSTVWIREPNGRIRETITDRQDPVHDLAWSPNGRYLARAAGSSLRLYAPTSDPGA